MTLENEIAEQLSQGKPVRINKKGEIEIVDSHGKPITQHKPVKISKKGEIVDSQGKPVTQLKAQTWYGWQSSNPGRLIQEKQAMNHRFPGFQLYNLQNGLTWIGYLSPKSSGSRSYKIAVVYPNDFPYSEPKVYTLSPKIRSPKHQYTDGSLCLMYPGDGTWNTNTTAVQIVAMTAAWLFCYEYHEKHCPTRCSEVPCKYWPGAEVH